MNRLESLLNFAKNHVPFHHRRAPTRHLILGEWPFMTKEDLEAYSLDKCNDLLSDSYVAGGYIVASGGTMSKPKYIFYTHEEVVALSRNIANHFMANGIEAGDGVVNFFTSGDMWSSFLLVDKALSVMPVTVFPLGYTARMDFATDVIRRFKPNVIAGIPSMILDLARYCADEKKGIRLEKVFYAGEPMSLAVMDLLRSTWDSNLIRSAGYASTDAGSIGWQCLHCRPGEHYAFEDAVVEIVNREIVVTSLMRYGMPIIRYRTGDRGRWVTPSCDCGKGAPMFQLMGRLDDIIIIWGCWISYSDIVSAFECLNVKFAAIQVCAYSEENGQYLIIKFESLGQIDRPADEQLRNHVYACCGDLNATVARDKLDRLLLFEAVPIGSLRRQERTGKVLPIIDSRS